MLYEFLAERRGELIDRCRFKVSQRAVPKVTAKELEHGIPLFLDQLTKTLCVEQTSNLMDSRRVSGPSGGVDAAFSEIGETAARHGTELQRHGFTVEQVVHDYGDLCQAITELSKEEGIEIEIDEFRTLNRCLDNGIAIAVTEFNYQRDTMLALTAIKAGNIGLGGATGGVLDRSLVGLRNLIDRSLANVRTTAGMVVENELFSLHEFIADVKLSASLEAAVKQCTLTVSEVDPTLAVDADKDLLFAAVGNLLQNAFKFTRHYTEVTLNSYAAADRILIEVEDKCGGLPEGFADKMFLPFTQAGEDQSGLGLGLSISRRSVEANGGSLSVRDLPGSGCIFTINLPRHTMPVDQASDAETAIPDPFQMEALSGGAKKLRILIAEDSSTNRKMLEYVFDHLGVVPTVSVKDGLLAVALSATGCFDLLLMDCNMPILNGYEAAGQIRMAEKLNPSRKRIHIVAISAEELSSERNSAEEAGMDDFLLKPLQLPLLSNVLERISLELV